MIFCTAIAAATLLALPDPVAEGFGDAASFNYAQALQATVYFLEAQQSGRTSPNNRVSWRGPACLDDGKDIGRDLSGGWFDAGDHWTANLTMSFTAMSLAWSAVEHPEGWERAGQMDDLLESLVHVNRYFLKCVLNPDCPDPAHDLDVAIGCGGREGVDPPNVHAMWAAAELAHLMTNRPTFRVNKDCPAGDIPGAMASAMAASAMVVRDHGAALRQRRGFEDFDPKGLADLLLDRAEKLTLFARANMGPVLDDKARPEAKRELQRRRNLAMRSDGKIVEIGYRSGPADKVYAAASWLARAAKTPEARRRWKTAAEEVYEGPYKAEFYNDFWKDSGAGNFGKVAAFNMLALDPSAEKYHHELQHYAVSFTKYSTTPGGLRLRENSAHEYGSLRHANNAAVIALYYSDLVGRSPALSGNTWWKGEKTNAELRDLFRHEAKAQVDYALGANPYGRSYLVGFGRDPFNNVHHRGAYGAWAGFNHFIDGKPERRDTSRHLLYGALVAGPDNRDVFLCGDKVRAWLPVEGTNDHDAFYRFPNRSDAPVRKSTYKFDPADRPVQDVMDSKFNEVALDYNAGFMASLAWLCAHDLGTGSALPDAEFPPPEARADSLELWATDREFFVSARLLADDATGTEVEARVWNRSRWPSRATDRLGFRYIFRHAGEVRASLADAPGAALGEIGTLPDGTRFVEVSWPGTMIFPGDAVSNTRSARLRLTGAGWDGADDPSRRGLTGQPRIAPAIPVYDHARQVGRDRPD